MARAGRKSRYDELKQLLPFVREKLESGMTEKEVAKEIGFAWSTWSKYKVQHPEFADFVKDCREKPAGKIRESMFLSALGRKVKVRKAMKTKTIDYEDGKRLQEREEVTFYDEEVYVPPNITAGIFLLTNWSPGEYARDAAALDIRKQELELKKKQAEKDDW